jgi:hypothetical protein
VHHASQVLACASQQAPRDAQPRAAGQAAMLVVVQHNIEWDGRLAAHRFLVVMS